MDTVQHTSTLSMMWQKDCQTRQGGAYGRLFRDFQTSICNQLSDKSTENLLWEYIISFLSAGAVVLFASCPL